MERYHIFGLGGPSKASGIQLDRCGDSLVFIFPLAPMLRFTSDVGKLNVRALWHHHMLLQVISQIYCQVFVKSYNFVFEKIDKEGSPREKWPKQGHFCPRAMGILPPPKYPRVVKQPPKSFTFSTTSVLLLLNVPLSLSRGTVFRRPKNPRRGYRPKIAGILFVCNEPEGKYYTVPMCQELSKSCSVERGWYHCMWFVGVWTVLPPRGYWLSEL